MTVEIGLTVASPARIESGKLSRHFGRFDILFFLICTIVGVDTIASVAADGGEAFTWMIVFAVVFFVPQALLFAELGTAFPQEGGPYLWTRLAFSPDFRPGGWKASEAGLYLMTELIPVLIFIGIGVLFWWRGKATRIANAEAIATSAETVLTK